MSWVKTHKTVEDCEESVGRFSRTVGSQDASLSQGIEILVESSGLHRIDWSVPKFEIGYWCRTRFTGHGYITEAVTRITAFAFDTLGARRVEIRCDPRNLPSARVAERAGFRLEGELRNNETGTDGVPRDTLIYAITQEDRTD